MQTRKERTLEWRAVEHHHNEKGSDWFWAVGIVALAGAITAIIFGNLLFAIVIILAATVVMIVSMRNPKEVSYTLTTRGVRIDDDFLPYQTLESFCIDEDAPHGPQLLLKSERLLMPLIIIPLPEEHIDAADAILIKHLNEEELEESFGHQLLEFFGF